MAYRNSFTYSEWQTLLFAPLWSFNAVAAIDGKVDDKEAEALAKEVAEASLYKNPLAEEVLTDLGASFASVFSAYRVDNRSVLDGLKEAAQLVDFKTMPDIALGFKKAIIGIGVQVANASGGVFGSKMSEDEKKALVLVAVTLGVRPEDLTN